MRNELLKLQALAETIHPDVWTAHPLPERLYAAILEMDQRLSVIESGLRSLDETLKHFSGVPVR